MKKVLLTLALTVTIASPALADGFTATLSAGTSPIAQAFSVRGVLAYAMTLTEGLTLSAQARVNYNSASSTFGLSLRVTPRYSLTLLEMSDLSVSAFGALDFLVRVLPTPVGLYVTPLVGVDLTYTVSDSLGVYAGTEFDLTVNFDGKPIVPSPFLSFYLEGDYSLIDALTVAFGSNIGTDFTGFYINPYLNLIYRLDSATSLILEGGYDNGGFLANTSGSYIFLRGRFRF